MNKKVFWTDTETSGLDSKQHDILQLAYLIEIDGEIKEEGNLEMQPFNYNTIDAKALEINKLSIAQIKKFSTPQEAYYKLITTLDRYIDKYNKSDKFSIGGFNVRFDTEFIRQFFYKNNNPYFGAYYDYHLLSIDSLLYLLDYAGFLKLENYKLITVAKHFGIEYDAHTALEDIKVTREVFYKMLEMIK